MRLPRFVATALCAAWTSAILAQPTGGAALAPPIPPFSAGTPGAALPPGWSTAIIKARKKPTQYDLVADGGTVVLHARSEAGASLLGFETSIDVAATPWAQWRWKVAALVPGADNRVRATEDSPARVIFEFDGDRGKLPLTAQAAFRVSKAVSGHLLAYATLMYIWSGIEPVGTIIVDPFTDRIRMIVVASGPSRVGQWMDVKRNLVDDFSRAFGELPGRLVSVSVLTDADNTGTRAEAWYGDITLSARPR